jgi:hypothetical protein
LSRWIAILFAIDGFERRSHMRRLAGAVFAILVATGIYVGSAAVSLNGLIQAVRAGDGAEVLVRTDLPRLRHALVDQIIVAYLKRVGRDRPIKPIERIVANTYGASVADALVGKMLTAESLTNMLKNGTVSLGDSETGDMQRLSELDTSKLFQTLRRFSMVKPVELFVHLGDDDGAGGISLHFEGSSWKLSGVQLPATALQAIAQTLADNKSRKD